MGQVIFSKFKQYLFKLNFTTNLLLRYDLARLRLSGRYNVSYNLENIK